MRKTGEILVIVLLSLIISPLDAEAFWFDEFFDGLEEWFFDGGTSTQIINKIDVSVNTGGNVADGEVKEGEAKAEVEIRNIINGEEIEPIDIDSEANRVEVESEIRVEEGETEVKREIEMDSKKEEKEHTIDLKNQESQAEDLGAEEIEGEDGAEENLSSFKRWWRGFVEELKSFFQNIFNIF